ncbi:MAG: DUF5011 domain-containing protein [Candidatus Nomurabacteria bacterium]|nr:DUF5011 domain-containing protein [Candidatus Nomurabacteria bacterium]
MKNIKTKLSVIILTIALCIPLTKVFAGDPDIIPPVISLNGEVSISIMQGTEYIDAGATASDDIDGDITINIQTYNYVDMSIAGDYVVKYLVFDAAGNQASAVRNITVTQAPPAPTITIHLDIETNSQTIYNQDINVTACDSDNTGTLSFSAYCAVKQAVATSDWSWWGDDAFLNSINNVTNNENNNGVYWGWFANLEYGQSALNKYILNSGDVILLNYDINPTKILVDSLTPTVGDTITITVQIFGLDSSWNAVWLPFEGADVYIGSETFTTDADGKVTYPTTVVGDFKIKSHKDESLDANPVIISVQETTQIDPPPCGGCGGGNPPPVTFSVPNAVAYLIGVQKSDGSFEENDMYTDWASIGLVAGNVSDSVKNNILDYMTAHNSVSSTLTSNERHTMALLALNQNPYSFHGSDFVTPIVNAFDGTQFGDSSQINDDVFALIALENSGYTVNDNIISKDIAYIISKQKSDGSWDGGIDMTSATIQALSQFSSIAEVSSALNEASNYLSTSQNPDGGWGNVDSTSWALQASNAINTTWTKNGHTGIDYLASNQIADGGVTNNSVQSNRIWSTSYAIPGVLGKTWNSIFHTVSKPTQTQTCATDVTLCPTPDLSLPKITCEIDSTLCSPKLTIEEKKVVLTKNIIAKVKIKKENKTNAKQSIKQAQQIEPINLTASVKNSEIKIPIIFSIIALIFLIGTLIYRFSKKTK